MNWLIEVPRNLSKTKTCSIRSSGALVFILLWKDRHRPFCAPNWQVFVNTFETADFKCESTFSFSILASICKCVRHSRFRMWKYSIFFCRTPLSRRNTKKLFQIIARLDNLLIKWKWAVHLYKIKSFWTLWTRYV